MKGEKSILMSKIEDSLEEDIVLYLKKNGESQYGEIIKELQISASKGQVAIFSLLRKEIIQVDKSSVIKLNTEQLNYELD